jgi:hypothetical protein
MFLEDFDQKDGILSWDRDLYLSLIQFMHTKTLRYYIGLSEESFQRHQHSYYHLYRIKYNKIHIRKLLSCVCDGYKYSGRSLISTIDLKSNIGHYAPFRLKETFIDCIFEGKYTYIPEVVEHNLDHPFCLVPDYIEIIKGIRYCFFGDDKCMICVDASFCSKSGENVLTIILDLNKDCSCCYIRFNDTPLTNVIRNIPYTKKQIEVWIFNCSNATLIHTMYLKNLPSDMERPYILCY